MDSKAKSIIVGLFAGVVFLFVLGIPTDVIPNNFFTRMTPVYFFDYFFLVTNSLLLGGYVGLHFYEKHEQSKKADIAAVGGGILNIFVIGCPICNALIVSLLGTSVALNYFAPLQPLLGAISTVIISSAIYFKIKNVKECKRCIRK